MTETKDSAALPRWEHFDHGADIGVRGAATTLSGAFEQAALALTAIVIDPLSLRLDEQVEIDCAAPDHEVLLVDWLNALIFEMATRGIVFGSFAVAISGAELHARARGQHLNLEEQELTVEPKGATYTALSVRQEDGAWFAQCVVDV